MLVKVFGPNIGKGEFHVHTADCADIKRGKYRHEYAAEWPMEFDQDSQQAIVEEVYADQIAENGPWVKDNETGYAAFQGTREECVSYMSVQANDARYSLEEPEDSTNWKGYAGEFTFFNCTKALKEER